MAEVGKRIHLFGDCALKHTTTAEFQSFFFTVTYIFVLELWIFTEKTAEPHHSANSYKNIFQ